MKSAELNGITIAYDVDGEGAPLIWVGGTGVGGGIWQEQIEHFRHSYKCVWFDLRGTGASSSPDVPYTVRVFADDLLALLDHLHIQRAHFAGFSLGSAILQRFALDHPDRVMSLIMISTWSSTRREEHIRLWFEARKMLLQAASRDVFQAFAFWMFAPSVIDEEPETVARVMDSFRKYSSAQPDHAYVRHFEADLAHDTRDELHQIQKPTLVVVGEEDLITLPAYNKEVAQRITGAALHVIPRAGHFLWLERPQLLNQTIEQFLGSVDN